VDDQTVYAGKHLSMVARAGWEFATRNVKRSAVGIVAVTDQNQVILVEQFRPPVGRRVIELPAGLAGDIAGAEDEALLEAAKRELWEETGYIASRWTELGMGFSSPGLTDESIVLFLAEGLTKQGAGGGDSSEDIQLHEVPLYEAAHWLKSHGHGIDMKLLAGLYLAQMHRMC
jgi:ADP-ribose pyrophosphatase